MKYGMKDDRKLLTTLLGVIQLAYIMICSVFHKIEQPGLIPGYIIEYSLEVLN